MREDAVIYNSQKYNTMKRFNIFNTIKVGGIALVAMLTTGCFAEMATPHKGCELGTTTDSYEVDEYADEIQIDVMSNMTYDISLLNEADWVSFPAHASNDDGFRVKYQENKGGNRMAKFLLSIPKYNHADTVYLKQRGVVLPYIKCEEFSMETVGSVASTHTVLLDTNIAASELEYSISYSDLRDGDWLNVTAIEAGEGENSVKLSFGVEANPDADKSRRAYIDVYYIDGWENRVVRQIFVSQQTSADVSGDSYTMVDLRAKSSIDGALVEEDIIIEGIVVSNKESMNMGENSQTSTITIDYDECLRTIYLESLDGEYGLMLKTKNVEDNVFNRYDKIRLCLNGAKLFTSKVVATNDPLYYWVEEVTSSMVVEIEPGSASDVPKKEKYIKDLTDNDIFTYVELQECCLPIRKGPLTPINEGYANATDADRVAKFAIPLLDRNGNSIYIYTNTTCPYRRTGERLPYGSGVMKGVIVHEKYTRFAWADNNSGDEETYGNIGRYQIRHTEYADLAMNKNFNNGFSEMLCEWTHVVAKNQTTYLATAGLNKNDETKAFMTHTFAYPVGNSLHGMLCINLYGDMSYLGPIGNNTKYQFGYNVTNKNGLGVILDDGTDWMSPSYSGVNSEYAANINSAEPGKGKVPAACGSAWRVWYNVDVNKGTKPACSYVYAFSTNGVSTDHITVQFGMLNSVSNGDYGPRYWNLEFSTTGYTEDDVWTHLARFSVPDEIIWSPKTQLWMCAGYKPMCYELPADKVCNKDMVYVRIRPEVTLHGSELEYATSQSNSANKGTVPWTGFNYFAVRYNK